MFNSLNFTEIALFFVTGVTLCGNYLISEGKRFGFLLGIITNLIFFTYDCFFGSPSHALLFIANAALSWNGWRRFKKLIRT